MKGGSPGEWNLGFHSWQTDEGNSFWNERYGNLPGNCDCEVRSERRPDGTAGWNCRIYGNDPVGAILSVTVKIRNSYIYDEITQAS